MATAHPEAAHGAGERRRPLWPWIALGIVLVVLVVAFFAIDAFARHVAEDEVETRVAEGLGVPAGTPVEARIGGGPVLFQLAAGRLSRVDVTVQDVVFGELAGDIDVRAEGVPLDQAGTVSSLDVRFVMPEEHVATFEPELSGLPLDTITLDDPDVETTTTFSLFGVTVSVGMALEPSASEGQLIFTPTAILVQDQEFSADSLRAAPGFGPLATVLLRQRPVCVAEQLPAALTLDRVAVEGATLVAELSARDASLAGFQTKGSCPE